MDENQLKQRIVGAIVLVALAVIFIPMLLSGDRDGEMTIIDSNIPDQPDNVARVRTLEIKPPSVPVPDEPLRRTPIDEQTPEPAAGAQPDTESAAADATDRESVVSPVTDGQSRTGAASGDSKAWAVQVGSFSKQSNALGLRDKLRKQGYSVFVEKVSTGNGDIYRVRVGPEVRRSKAEELQKDLQARLKLDGLVVAHP